MTRPSIIVLADDLTGAAEAAAVGHGFGFESTVVTGGHADPVPAEFVVHDTDSRLDPPARAASKVAMVAGRVGPGRGDLLVFKKTDSVLRGPVLAEVETLAEALGLPRILLVPANPALGRLIRDGRYLVGGVPIDETAFAHDPHHPAISSRIIDLLGPAQVGPVHVLPLRSAPPSSGVVVGEVGSPGDLDRWAESVDDETLPAGSSVFLAAVLRARGLTPPAPSEAPAPAGPMLLVSGTTAPTTRKSIRALGDPETVPVFALPGACFAAATPAAAAAALGDLAGRISAALKRRGTACVLAPEIPTSEPRAPERIRDALAALVRSLHGGGSFRHLAVEGGATAAAIVRALGWPVLDVVREHAPGVITLRPRAAPGCSLTLKPGSYPWPDGWWENLAGAAHPHPNGSGS